MLIYYLMAVPMAMGVGVGIWIWAGVRQVLAGEGSMIEGLGKGLRDDGLTHSINDEQAGIRLD